MPKREALVPAISSAPLKTLTSFSDARWARIKSSIPEALSAETDERLRAGIMKCCSWFLTQKARTQEGQETAAAMRDLGKRQLAPFKRMAKSLREAAEAWKKVGKSIHDDRLSDLGEYDRLELMAQDAERRLEGFRRLGGTISVVDPWPEFVRMVAGHLREAGLNPTISGAVYDSKPTWFQEFMATVDKNLLGTKNLLGVGPDGAEFERDHRAFFAAVAKAMRGDGKPGKARQQTT